MSWGLVCLQASVGETRRQFQENSGLVQRFLAGLRAHGATKSRAVDFIFFQIGFTYASA